MQSIDDILLFNWFFDDFEFDIDCIAIVDVVVSSYNKSLTSAKSVRDSAGLILIFSGTSWIT